MLILACWGFAGSHVVAPAVPRHLLVHSCPPSISQLLEARFLSSTLGLLSVKPPELWLSYQLGALFKELLVLHSLIAPCPRIHIAGGEKMLRAGGTLFAVVVLQQLHHCSVDQWWLPCRPQATVPRQHAVDSPG